MDAAIAGRVVSLQLNVGHRKPLLAVENATFVAGRGIEGDRHYSEKPDRQVYSVLLIDEETLNALGLPHGAVREQVTTVGVDLAALELGRKLALGERAVVQISKPATPCSRMDEVRQGLRQELEGRRGMLAGIVRGGKVEVGDSISVLEDTPD